jgi:hypothetical protein
VTLVFVSSTNSGSRRDSSSIKSKDINGESSWGSSIISCSIGISSSSSSNGSSGGGGSISSDRIGDSVCDSSSSSCQLYYLSQYY